ncbi:RNA polymerase sigma factor [Planctomycetes bacterium K23_9]|uniref:ECF RNA polymerase sigma-E factor n=1 Tax=Stieleria marina TaxID=1930275 RepID=A0A517NS72_9BACT|nr:ECF RNA polymerase sigma-E factor [Planctomycetes bacterium K23_9]
MKSFETSTAVLVVRCQLGETDAWELLVQRWHPRLARFVVNMIVDRANADDVMQTAWLRIVRSLNRLRAPERFEAWAFRVARLSVMDHLRRQYREPVSEAFAESEQGSPSAEREAERIEIEDLVRVGLDELHATEREVIVLHYLEQLNVAEVAMVCNVPPGTVKSRLFRARATLRQKLTEKESNNDESK